MTLVDLTKAEKAIAYVPQNDCPVTQRMAWLSQVWQFTLETFLDN